MDDVPTPGGLFGPFGEYSDDDGDPWESRAEEFDCLLGIVGPTAIAEAMDATPRMWLPPQVGPHPRCDPYRMDEQAQSIWEDIEQGAGS
jgi:hypothetical protein